MCIRIQEVSVFKNPTGIGSVLNRHGPQQEDVISAYLALGDGGNAICCIPEKDMVVAIASGFMMKPRDRWGLIRDYMLRATTVRPYLPKWYL